MSNPKVSLIPGSHPEAPDVRRRLLTQSPIGRARRAGYAVRAAVHARSRGGALDKDTAAQILAGMTTEAGRDVTLLVFLGLNPEPAVYDTEGAGAEYASRVLSANSKYGPPIEPNLDHSFAIDVLTDLVKMAPPRVAPAALAELAFLLWFTGQRETSFELLLQARDLNPAMPLVFRFGPHIAGGYGPGHVQAVRYRRAN